MDTLNRRSVVKGAAWSIPVVTVAAAAPAMAGSCLAQSVTLTARTGQVEGSGAIEASWQSAEGAIVVPAGATLTFLEVASSTTGPDGLDTAFVSSYTASWSTSSASGLGARTPFMATITEGPIGVVKTGTDAAGVVTYSRRRTVTVVTNQEIPSSAVLFVDGSSAGTTGRPLSTFQTLTDTSGCPVSVTATASLGAAGNYGG